MKKLFAFGLLCLAAWGVAAQTTVKLRNPATPNTPTVQASPADTCVPAGHANAQTMAQEWGATLATEGMNSRNARAARAQWKLAAQCYSQAARLDPTDSNAVNGWAMSLGLEARALAPTDLPAARALFRQVNQKLALAMRLNPLNSVAAYHWGIALGDEAMAITAAVPSDLAGASVLWQLARQKYALGLEIDHNDAQIADNWGATYATEAQALANSNLPAARALWQQAYDRFAEAISINPKQGGASYNLAGAMMAERTALLKAPLAPSTQASAEAADLLQRAKKVLLNKTNDPKAKGAYNLACVYALEGQAADAMQWLQRSAAAGSLPAKSHIAQDSDLDGIRSAPAFAQWFAQLE
jgi:hypothetical protein